MDDQLKSLTNIGVIRFVEEQLALGCNAQVAIAIYDKWLADRPGPDRAAVLFNQGVLLSNIGAHPKALENYQLAASLVPNFWQAHANLANLLEKDSQVEEALNRYDVALRAEVPAEGKTFLLNQKGRLLEAKRDFAGAVDCYSESLKINPEQIDTFQHWFYLRQKTCQWPQDVFQRPMLVKELAAQMGPLSAMAFFDDPEMLAESCNAWVQRYRRGKRFSKIAEGRRYGHERIRIGYVSCDFRMHAVCFLTAQMYECHDRTRFEVIGFDFSKPENSVWRDRVIKGMDAVYPIHNLTDEQAADFIAQKEIDILVDMVGLTANGRPGIFMHKPAPIQVSYLGFLGPVAAPEIDYIVCDEFVVPRTFERYYGAKPLHVPFYQCNNRLRESAGVMSRSDFGLPDDKFVYCVINNSYKITPVMFDRWMKILDSVPNSVLWMLEENDSNKKNLMDYARTYGVDDARIIFAKPIDPRIYLSRFACADLFLDSSPYNAGITASDAVWMGLPVLTCPGKTFVSRMAADLLIHLNLDSFVCDDWGQYIDRAISFGRLGNAREIFDKTFSRESPIFDTPNFVRHLEAQFISVYRDL
jgi:predicted O-linked N-acetylglucosamine transferase (SPINDLY family)